MCLIIFLIQMDEPGYPIHPVEVIIVFGRVLNAVPVQSQEGGVSFTDVMAHREGGAGLHTSLLRD